MLEFAIPWLGRYVGFRGTAKIESTGLRENELKLWLQFRAARFTATWRGFAGPSNVRQNGGSLDGFRDAPDGVRSLYETRSRAFQAIRCFMTVVMDFLSFYLLSFLSSFISNACEYTRKHTFF